jgi:hypothetical protein
MSLRLLGFSAVRVERPREAWQAARPTVRILGKVIYWLAVLAISVALLIALVLFFESRDQSEIEDSSVVLIA